MSENALKDIFTFSDEEREKLFVVFISISLFFICIVIASWMLPQNCSLFSSNVENGFACDGIDFANPQPCPPVCHNTATATIAAIIAGLGFSLFFIPFFIYAIRDWRNRSMSQTKLFG